MHVTHLDDQIIATRFVLSSGIPLRGAPELRPCERGAWQRDLGNGSFQQTPSHPHARPDSGRRAGELPRRHIPPDAAPANDQVPSSERHRHVSPGGHSLPV